MRLLKTGKYDAPIELEWNECLVDYDTNGKII